MLAAAAGLQERLKSTLFKILFVMFTGVPEKGLITSKGMPSTKV